MFPPLFDDNEDQEVLDYIHKNEKMLRKTFNEKLETLEKTLEVMVAGVNEAKRQKLKSLECVWNFSGYINSTSFDLAVTGEALMFESNQWKKRYYGRMASVNIFEACLDIPNMTGKAFRKEASKLQGGEEFLVLLGSKIKKLKKFQSENSAWLKKVRLYCAAHREQDLSKQLDVMFNMSPTKILKIMAEFDALLNEFGEVTQVGINLLPSRTVA